MSRVGNCPKRMSISQQSASGASPLDSKEAKKQPDKEDKEKKETDKRDKHEREKAEREAHASKPLSKAATWARGLVKDMGIAQTWINEIERSDVPAGT